MPCRTPNRTPQRTPHRSCRFLAAALAVGFTGASARAADDAPPVPPDPTSPVGDQKMEAPDDAFAGDKRDEVDPVAALVARMVPARWANDLKPEALPPLDLPAYYTEAETVAAEVFHGRYRAALSALAASPSIDPADAAVLRARALTALGGHDRAVAALSDPRLAADAAVRLQLGRTLADAGRWDKSIDALRRLAGERPESVPVHYALARALEDSGDVEGAVAAYGWFVADPSFGDSGGDSGAPRPTVGAPGLDLIGRWRDQNVDGFADAEELTLAARGIDGWARMTGSYPNLPRLHETLLSMFTAAYDRLDRDYWPARVAEAEFLLAHGDPESAVASLGAALKANPYDEHALDLLGRTLLAGANFAAVDAAVGTIRQLDYQSPAADLLEARSQLRQVRPAVAERFVRRVLDRRPRDVEALGLLAASQALQLRDDESAATLAAVDAIDPGNYAAYADVADALADRRQTPRAEAAYQTAIERAPWWSEPRNGLAMLYANAGEEDKARAALERAYAVDPFNARTVNYLRVMDRMAGWDRHETEHFTFLYDPRDAAFVPEYLAPYMESIYADVAAAFRHEPADKTIVEVFPDKNAFSVRLAGQTGVETYGANIGRVVTAVAPRPGVKLGNYAWARILRHEFTHRINASATEGRVPRWLTEGLAVWQEGVPYRFEWILPVMYDAAVDDGFFPLASLDTAYYNLKKPTDGELAYMQGFWVVLFLRDDYGPDSVLDLLDAFTAGKTTPDAFAAATGDDIDAVQAKFDAWAKQHVEGWGYDAATTAEYEAARSSGEAAIATRDYAGAADAFEAVAALRPMETLAHKRLAGLYLKLGRPDDAVRHLRALNETELTDNRYAKRIAQIELDAGRPDAAIDAGVAAIRINPYDDAAHALLADAYAAANRPDDAAKERRVIDLLTAEPATPEDSDQAKARVR